MASIEGSSCTGDTVSTSVVESRNEVVCFGFREGVRTFGAVGGRVTASTFGFIIITVVKMDYSNCCLA
jgi:hypothetical protein